MASIVEFIRIKHNSLVQFVGLAIAALVGFDIISWTDDQIALVLGLVTGFFVLFGSQTVTANARLTGRVFEGFSGADPNMVAAHELMKVSEGKPGMFVAAAPVEDLDDHLDDLFGATKPETAEEFAEFVRKLAKGDDTETPDDYRNGGRLDDGPLFGER